jgi:excisionase family DNA binding protein
MEKIEIIQLTPAEFRAIISESVEGALRKLKEEDQKPSDWEDITVEQAAAELNCSMRTMRRRMKELKINGFRVGKKITLQRKDLKKIKQAS